MTKFIKSIALVLFGINFFILFSFLNIKYLFPSAGSVKNTLAQSNIYSLVSAGIRTNLIDSASSGPGKEALMEVANDAINGATSQAFTDKTIDQFYQIVKSPNTIPTLVLPFSIFGDKITTALTAKNIPDLGPATDGFLHDRQVNLQNNLFYLAATNLGSIIIFFSITAFIFLAVLILPEAWPKKMKWAGGAFLFSGLLISVQAIVYWIGLSPTVQNNIVQSSNLEDAKFLIAAQKILTMLLQNQKIYYLVVALVLIVLGTGLMIWGRSMSKREQVLDLG